MKNIRRAKQDEAELLTQIAIDSESHWGEDEEFIKRFSLKYRVTDTFIVNNPTYVLEEDGEVVGFYAITYSDDATELEYFYIRKDMIGKGYGKLLWTHLEEECKCSGISSLELVTSPEALAFYERLGARKIGVVESILREGRMIPKLEYQIHHKD